jgi:hypothetical protein
LGFSIPLSLTTMATGTSSPTFHYDDDIDPATAALIREMQAEDAIATRPLGIASGVDHDVPDFDEMDIDPATAALIRKMQEEDAADAPVAAPAPAPPPARAPARAPVVYDRTGRMHLFPLHLLLFIIECGKPLVCTLSDITRALYSTPPYAAAQIPLRTADSFPGVVYFDTHAIMDLFLTILLAMVHSANPRLRCIPRLDATEHIPDDLARALDAAISQRFTDALIMFIRESAGRDYESLYSIRYTAEIMPKLNEFSRSSEEFASHWRRNAMCVLCRITQMLNERAVLTAETDDVVLRECPHCGLVLDTVSDYAFWLSIMHDERQSGQRTDVVTCQQFLDMLAAD